MSLPSIPESADRARRGLPSGLALPGLFNGSMKMKINFRTVCLAVAIFLFPLAGCAAGGEGYTREERVYMIGDREIRVVEHSRGEGGLTIFNMHDDEDTAVEASLEVIGRCGGRLIELRHTGQRLISFHLGTEAYQFDPNRIFTGEGIRKTLERYSTYSHPAFDAVRGFADSLLADYGLAEGGLVVTAHNNGSDEYSASSYLPGAEYENDAAEVYLADGSDPDDFFFVTTPEAFAGFKAAGFNVVLQNNRTVTDDGSLSVLAGRKGIPYINCEAEKGHLAEQVRMLEAVAGIFGD